MDNHGAFKRGATSGFVHDSDGVVAGRDVGDRERDPERAGVHGSLPEPDDRLARDRREEAPGVPGLRKG
jgi:hypothetical protein